MKREGGQGELLKSEAGDQRPEMMGEEAAGTPRGLLGRGGVMEALGSDRQAAQTG